MARKKRIWYEGACYHIMGRGNRRCSIFRSEEDYALFLRIRVALESCGYDFSKDKSIIGFRPADTTFGG